VALAQVLRELGGDDAGLRARIALLGRGAVERIVSRGEILEPWKPRQRAVLSTAS
jgi:hypothetical protein